MLIDHSKTRNCFNFLTYIQFINLQKVVVFKIPFQCSKVFLHHFCKINSGSLTLEGGMTPPLFYSLKIKMLFCLQNLFLTIRPILIAFSMYF